jgi:hypothetical protein
MAILCGAKLFLECLLGSVRRSAPAGLAHRIVAEGGIQSSDYRDYFLIVGVYTRSR